MKFLYIFVLLLTLSCAKKTDSLNLFIDDLSKTWNNKTKDSFSSSSELTSIQEIDYEFAKIVHHKIYNTEQGEKLVDYLKSRGLDNETDIGRIVSISLHRKLNNVDIDLESQIEQVKINTERLEKCKKLLNEKSKRDYINYNITDTIYIRLPMDTKNSNAVLYECPGLMDWIKNAGDNDDIILKSILKKKIKSKSENNKFLIEVIKLSKQDVTFLYKDITVGDTLEIQLDDGFLLSKVKPNFSDL